MSYSTDDIRKQIDDGQATMGIEFGSTRIKAVLIGKDNSPVASGSYDWENSLIAGIWSYSLDDIWKGLQGSYHRLSEQVKELYGTEIRKLAAIGISGMMHGYMAFDNKANLLAPFRTWRNNITGPASEALTQLFDYPIPQRWSIAHLYQSILNGEEHVSHIDFMTTLAGYIHWKLTGSKVVGIGEASGIFPVDSQTKTYKEQMLQQFRQLIDEKNYQWDINEILPSIMVAGEKAGELSAEGARLIDPAGKLLLGIPMCPPEGDAGTGMVSTNSVSIRTGNISAGTSVFAMIVLEKELSRAYPEIDLVTTPEGKLVAMVHSNNCTSDIDAWMGILNEAAKALGADVGKDTLYKTLYSMALQGDADCGGLLAYGYVSGEHITKFEEGRPLFVRSAGSNFNLANFIRVNLFAALGALRTGLDILFEKESVTINEIMGHGGFFKIKEVGPKIMSTAIQAPVTVLDTAGEGGAWGISLLASYMANGGSLSLEDFLKEAIFKGNAGTTVAPDKKDVEGFNKFMKRYSAGLAIERAAVESLE